LDESLNQKLKEKKTKKNGMQGKEYDMILEESANWDDHTHNNKLEDENRQLIKKNGTLQNQIQQYKQLYENMVNDQTVMLN
jgi:hypothetical protein